MLRVLYVLVVTRHSAATFYDAFWYDFQAAVLTQGHFFPVLLGTAPDASHPPLTSVVLVPATWLFGLHPGQTPQRLTMAVLGTAVVVVVGLLGRRMAGPAVGLVTAAVATLYPNMWMPSGIVMSETLAMLGTGLILLAVFRLLQTPRWTNAALVGMACGVEMLVRAESVVLVPLLLVPAAWACTFAWRRRLALAGVALLGAGVVVGPWMGRNLVSFRDTTFLSTGEGGVAAGSNCAQTYSGPALGGWSLGCVLAVSSGGDQSAQSAHQVDAATHYVEHHLGRLPVVLAARVGRVWDLYEPIEMAHSDVDEGRPEPASLAGLAAYYALVPLAGFGIVALRRRGTRQWPLLVPALMVTVVALAGYGQVRFRAEFEPSLVVLAAVGIGALLRVPTRPVGVPGPGHSVQGEPGRS